MRVLGLLLLVLTACARPYPPTGGEDDREPPRVLSTTPVHESVVPGFNQKVIFEFDETLSERGMQDVVLVSPETGTPRAKRSGNKLEVSVEGGWKPNTIYRVVVAPTVQDRRGNVRREPAEIVFSTGPELIPTAVAGAITDRITGKPTAGARVVAVSARDSSVHATVTDTAGFFGLRFLPLGRYTLQAYEDANRNRKFDFNERFVERSIVVPTVRDTQVVELAVMARDTTPARLLRAEARDSMEVRLSFDDHLDVDGGTANMTVGLYLLPDSTLVGTGGRLFHPRVHERMRAAADSARRAAAAADTSARAQSDTTRRPPITAPAAPLPSLPAAAPDTVTRPSQELVFVPNLPLAPRTRYRIFVSNVRNLAGLPNGGGSAAFTTRARPTATDSLNNRRTPPVRRDTIGAARRFH